MAWLAEALLFGRKQRQDFIDGCPGGVGLIIAAFTELKAVTAAPQEFIGAAAQYINLDKLIQLIAAKRNTDAGA